jgi:UDP:flavonoid glycosyltransferase YjiC (YdhE family)
VDFGAMVAAERLGIPFATVACIASGAFGSDDLLREPLDRLRSEHGLPPDPAVAMRHRHLMLVPIPLALRRRPARPLPATVRPIRPAPVPGASPDWLDDLAGPVVSVTLGTIFNLESGDLFERILAGLAPLPVEVVATVGRELDPETLGPQHGSVRVEQFVAQDALLPRCAVAVSHGGSGSVVGALAHGVPLVLLPLGADQPLNAARCAELGVARVLEPFSVTSAEIGRAVAVVLGDPSYRRNAQRIAVEAAEQPGPEEAVGWLERLAGR